MIIWKTIRALKSHGGLGVKDPILANLDFGENMLWKMITRDYTNWKTTLVLKYFHGDNIRGLKLHINTTTISPI
jgi:hypothetical protein